LTTVHVGMPGPARFASAILVNITFVRVKPNANLGGSVYACVHSTLTPLAYASI